MSARPRPRAFGWRHKAFLILFGLALAGGALAGLEAALRAFGIGDEPLYGDPFVGFATGQDLFDRRTLADGTEVFATRPEKLAYFNPQEFAADKAAATYRVFTLGGSTTAGRPYDHSVSFSTFLERYLRAMDPSRDWEVINAGAISYASYRVVLLMKELVRYEPDLFVVYTGHNEFLEDRIYPPLIHRSLTAKRLWIWLNGQRTYGLGRRLVRALRARGGDTAAEPRTQLAAEVTAKPDDWIGMKRYHRDTELRQAIIEHFEYNLYQIAAIARAAGAEVILVKPVSNLKDFSPFKSEHSAALGAEDLARFESLATEADSLAAAGDHAAAARLLEQAVALDPVHAEVRFRLGRALFALGREQEARAAFVRAKDEDIAPLRALEALADLIPATGASLGIPVIDLPAILEAESRRRHGHGILGNEFLLDHVHPDIPVHSRIAEEIIAVLTERGIVRPAESWSANRRREIYGEILGSVDRHGYAQRDLNLAKVLGWAGKTAEAEEPLRRAAEVLTDNPEVHLNLGIVLQKLKRWEEAAAALDKALALDASSPKVHFNLGLVYNGMGKVDAAIAAFETAIGHRPGYPEALYNLGVLQLRQDPAAALQTLRSALSAKPDAAETHTQLGFAHRELDQLRQARAAFERALELDPSSAAARAGLGGTFAREGVLDRAEALLREALDIDPALFEAQFDLGLVLARTGRPEEALERYRRAIALEPSFAPALNNLGIALAGQGRIESAVDHLERAVQAAPAFAEARFNLGVAYAQSGRRSEAAEAIAVALELEPDNGRFHLALGMLLLADGPGDRALSHLRRAERLGEELPPEMRPLLSGSQ